MKNVIVIGAGFVGQSVAQALGKDPAFAVTIMNDKTMVSYKPLWPDVVGGRLSPDVVEYPLKDFAAENNARHIIGAITGIDFARNTVLVSSAMVPYDYCVIAPGVVTTFYDREMWRPFVTVVDSADDCRALQAKVAALVAEQRESVRIAIMGGGYTGIEYASQFVRWFKRRKVRYEVTIADIAPDILGPLSTPVREQVKRYLAKRNVKIKTNVYIRAIEPGIVYLENEVVRADIVLWAAGMRGADLCGRLGLPQERGRVKVDQTLRPAGFANVFVAGDAASLYRMAVPIAKQYGDQVVKNIRALEAGRAITPFKVKDYGYVIALAEDEGIGEIMGIPLKGLIGYVFHYFMCGLTLLGKKNKWRLIKSLIMGEP